MDRPAETLQNGIGGLFRLLGRPGRALKNVRHGTTVLHHPLHPAVTDIPMGAGMVGVVADLAAHWSTRVAPATGDIALAVGLAVAVVAALSGYTDFHETFGHERRVALTHGITMTAVFVIESVSLALRWWAGSATHPLAVGLAVMGLGLAIAGAYFGGHLVFGMATMVNRNAVAEGPEEVVTVGRSSDFAEGALVRVMAGPLPVLVVRRGGRLHAVGAVCSHAGGPLDEGTLEGDAVVCPWHQSRFCLADGRAVGGPATFGQPVLDVSETDEVVTVRLTEPLH